MSHNSAHHIVPKSLYYLIFLILMVGTGLTWWIATIDLGAMNNVLMLGIAVTKATLVVLFFMHVKYSSRLTWLVVAGAVFFLMILIVLTLNDYLARSWGSYGLQLWTLGVGL
jgi:cytochrome c oxidase subunit 4